MADRIPENPLAFPLQDGPVIWPGMTLRDYFAAQALVAAAGIHWGNDWGLSGKEHAPRCAAFAYAIADAMLAAREKQP